MFFNYFTPIIYWLLVIIWLYIFIFYLKKINRKSENDKLLKLLLLILTIDAFRTLFESIYFGAWYTSLAGIIPIEVFNYLAKPQIVFFPKIINLIAAIIVLQMLIRKWLPSEIIQKNKINLQIETQISELLRANKRLKVAKENAEQKANELKNQKILFESMFNTITDGIVITNINREIIVANNGMKNTFGYEPKELIGKSTQILYESNNAFNNTGEMIFNKATQSSENNYVTYYKDKNNKIFPGETFGTKLFDANKQWIGNLGIMRDISKRLKMTEDLIIAKQKAEESDQLKSAFLANMSHEIRTPMNGILGFSELLKNPKLSGEQQYKYIEIIKKSGNRMLNIINDIIDISKIEAGLMNVEIKESNINEQVEYIYTFFKPEVEAKGMQLFFKNTLPTKEAVIKTDREKFYAILTNLVKNAIKYCNEGSIEFGYERKGGYLEFFIKDTGIGISKDKQEAIFERFIQAEIEDEMARQGAGLGLSITKSYIEMLGGKIWVESEEGIGSTFYFTLPYNCEMKEKSGINDSKVIGSLENHVKNLKILIAEDDEASEMLLSINVSEFGNEIIKATTGREAIEACGKNPDIDLILMDIQMPDLNGYEATRQIRQFNKNVVIIAQTAFGLAGDREKSLDAGCNDYITKPINQPELDSLIQKYFNKL